MAALVLARGNALDPSWGIESYQVNRTASSRAREAGFLPLFPELIELSHALGACIEGIDGHVAADSDVIFPGHFQGMFHVRHVIV